MADKILMPKVNTAALLVKLYRARVLMALRASGA